LSDEHAAVILQGLEKYKLIKIGITPKDGGLDTRQPPKIKTQMDGTHVRAAPGEEVKWPLHALLAQININASSAKTAARATSKRRRQTTTSD
jgi:hypothetical protein